MENRELCPIYCGGNLIQIGKPPLKQENLKMWENEERVLYFSIVGNNPETPKIAIVGLSPGQNQLKILLREYERLGSFEEAAKVSGFARRVETLARVMRALRIDRELGITIGNEYNFNKSPHFFITSLVKCALLGKGRNPSKHFPPLEFEVGKKCIQHRFMKDILSMKEKGLKRVFILGKEAWKAVNSSKVIDGNKSVKETLEEEGLIVEHLPHPSWLRYEKNIKKFEEEHNKG